MKKLAAYEKKVAEPPSDLLHLAERRLHGVEGYGTDDEELSHAGASNLAGAPIARPARRTCR